MDNLLKKQSVCLTSRIVHHQEECVVSGEFSLPEYCPDVTAMLKCVIEPRIQNRQQSGDQLLVDGEACARILYLDEERKCLRCAEFALPFSGGIRGVDQDVDALPYITMMVKYVNCRVVTPRRLEIRGAILLSIHRDACATKELATAVQSEDVFCKSEEIVYTKLVGYTERVVSINESLTFPDGLPPAEMLLGGECRSVIRECKLLNGKAIVKGEVYVHQLYTDNVSGGKTYCLDYVLPFGQILDMEGIQESHRPIAQVMVLSDVERCGVGPDGNANVLEFTAKLLVRLQVYQPEMTSMLLDAYHTQCPMDTEYEDIRICEHKGMQIEQPVFPLQLPLPERNVREIIDVWVTPQMVTSYCENGLVHVNGRLLVSVIYRDSDGCIAFTEKAEEFHTEYPSACSESFVDARVIDLHYRVVDDTLELQVTICLCIENATYHSQKSICATKLHLDSPFAKQRATAMVYYADAGESVWEIAKTCHTSPDRICMENQLQNEVMDKCSVLVVPMI